MSFRRRVQAPSSASVLKSIVSQLLREAEEPKKEKGEDSIDDQVDRLLTSYESEAKNLKKEGLDFKMVARRFILEAEEDEKKDEKDKEASEEKITSEDFDVKSYVTDVMRLVDNYDNLLEVRNTILRRAANRLADAYEADILSSFKEQLLETYGIEIGQTEAEKKDDERFQAPRAGGAGPMAGGA